MLGQGCSSHGTIFFLRGTVENRGQGGSGEPGGEQYRVFEDSCTVTHFEIAKARTFRQNFREHSGRKIFTPVGLTAE